MARSRSVRHCTTRRIECLLNTRPYLRDEVSVMWAGTESMAGVYNSRCVLVYLNYTIWEAGAENTAAVY